MPITSSLPTSIIPPLSPKVVLMQLQDLAERLTWESVADLEVPGAGAKRRWNDLRIEDCKPHIPEPPTHTTPVAQEFSSYRQG